MKGKIKLNFLFPLATAILSAVWMYKGFFEYGIWDETIVPFPSPYCSSQIGSELILQTVHFALPVISLSQGYSSVSI